MKDENGTMIKAMLSKKRWNEYFEKLITVEALVTHMDVKEGDKKVKTQVMLKKKKKKLKEQLTSPQQPVENGAPPSIRPACSC